MPLLRILLGPRLPHGVLIMVAAAALLGACGKTRTSPTNLLLITLDTLRADRLGLYGYPRPTSPHLDAFALRSTVFTDVTCSMPTTLPSHLSIFTGLDPSRHGVWSNGVRAEEDLTSLFDLLGEQGRQSAAIVASSVLASEFLPGMGFDAVVDHDLEAHEHQLPGSLITARARDWLTRKGRSPFALWVHYYDTHEPYAPAPETAAAFGEGYQGDLGNTLAGSWLNRLNREGAEHLSEADRAHIANLYDAEVHELDRAVGALLATLEDLDLAANTLVVILGDHGQALGEQEHFGHGEWLLEAIIKVPLIIRLPGQVEGRVVKAPVETLDLLPTVADIFSLSPPAGIPGRSLLPALEGRALPPAGPRITLRRSYASAPERQGITLSRGGEKWTFLRESDGDFFHLGHPDGRGGLDGESFHRKGSPMEANLSALVEEMMALSERGSELSPETKSMLQSLGYVH